MTTIKLFDRRVDIDSNHRFNYPGYHCYLYGNNYLCHYRYYSTWWKALLFLFGYESKPE